jgi:hypothetical protein
VSFKLRLASIWMPRASLRRELLHVEEVTNAALDSALRLAIPNYRPEGVESIGRDLADLRARMAQGHKKRVELLIGALGRQEALAVGRDALFQAGLRLGGEARTRLEVKDEPDDLLRAARIMYRVLGIEFDMIFKGGRGEMRVHRCAMADHYTADTCSILSATDEGVVHGLSPRAEMKFTRHITSGSEECVADVAFTEG